MFYVIPSWYGEPTKTPFDDAVQHITLFHAAGEAAQLVVLSYMPQLRYFLHQKDLLELPTWSLFDALQGISEVRARLLSFRDLSWPEGTAFTFTPFVIIAYHNGEVIAHIRLGDSGQLSSVDYFDAGQLVQVLTFDDRGFISRVAYYVSGQESHRDYLNRYGIWQFREYVRPDQRRVEVNPSAHYPFKQLAYASLNELQAEVIKAYLTGHLKADDVVFIASDSRHNESVFASLSGAKTILSFFEGRDQISQKQDPTMLEQLSQADLVITDKRQLVETLQGLTDRPVRHVTPFDTRLRLGHSSQVKEQYLYVVLDGLDTGYRDDLLTTLFALMAEDDSLQLCLVSYDMAPSAKATCRHQIMERLAEADSPYLFLEDEETPQLGDFDELSKSRVSLHQTRDEQELIQLLDKARLVIDLADEPDLYTQIAAISAGIPQVNSYPTEFVVHQQNGYLVDEVSQLAEVHAYYLKGLRHWNEALVYATQKLADYTSGRLVSRLKEEMGLGTDA